MEASQSTDLDLAGISLFADLGPSQLEAVFQACEEEHAEPETRLLREGFVGNGFYVILSGEAAWIVGGRRAERAATIIGDLPKPVTLRRGDWFGELSVLFNEPAISDVVALTPMRLLVLPGGELEEFLFRFPKVMFRLLQGEARRLRDPERWR
jgi:CRP/FNR family transcriptional regulator, cyclic AMP receptor protein